VRKIIINDESTSGQRLGIYCMTIISSLLFARRRSTAIVLLGTATCSAFTTRTLRLSSLFSDTKPPWIHSTRAMSMLASNTAVQHVDSNALPDWMRCERTKVLNSHTTPKESGKSIVYWMQRDVRTVDNWALLYAAWLAEHHDVPLHVMYCLHPPPIEQVTSDLPPKIMVETKMTQRHGSFLLGGLQCVHSELKQKNVPLHVILPTSPTTVGDAVVDFLDSVQPRSVVCDFSPLRTYRNWMEHQTAPRLMQIPMIQVDAHNVVPVWHASPKREVGARTLRPKLHKVVDTFLTDFPSFGGNTHVCPTCPEFAMDTYTTYLDMDTTVPPVPWAKPGTAHAMIQFDAFAKSGLAKFDELRNNPNLPNVCSNPYRPGSTMGMYRFKAWPGW
jgi:deoxyribodipyrimidine photo-lyase